ncbi:hypothetical protein AHAS_Ahas06G0224200 [Arachis hypogaea]
MDHSSQIYLTATRANLLIKLSGSKPIPGIHVSQSCESSSHHFVRACSVVRNGGLEALLAREDYSEEDGCEEQEMGARKEWHRVRETAAMMGIKKVIEGVDGGDCGEQGVLGRCFLRLYYWALRDVRQ